MAISKHARYHVSDRLALAVLKSKLLNIEHKGCFHFLVQDTLLAARMHRKGIF